MSTILQVSDAIEWVLTDYPRQIERTTHFVQRSSAKLDGPTVVQSLVFGTSLVLCVTNAPSRA